MDTVRSDQIADRWKTTPNVLKRNVMTFQKTIQATPEKVFLLLCPTKEYDWIPGWECELLHSRSGYAEYNCIFRSDILGTEEIWICTRFEPDRAIEYTRVSENIATILRITIVDLCNGSITIQWTMTVSALNETGNQMIHHFDVYRERLQMITQMLEHYLATGTMIPGKNH